MTQALTSGPAGVDDTALVSQAEYARRRGISREAVRRQVDAKKIDSFGPDKQICPRLADAQWAERVRARADGGQKAPAAAGPAPAAPQALPGFDSAAGGAEKPPAATDPTYADARRRRERADAERAELETAQLAGRLVDRRRVEAAVFDAFRVLRDRVMAVPRRCASAVVGLVEVREVELAIADELRRALGLMDGVPALDDAAIAPAVATMTEKALAA